MCTFIDLFSISKVTNSFTHYIPFLCIIQLSLYDSNFFYNSESSKPTSVLFFLLLKLVLNGFFIWYIFLCLLLAQQRSYLYRLVTVWMTWYLQQLVTWHLSIWNTSLIGADCFIWNRQLIWVVDINLLIATSGVKQLGSGERIIASDQPWDYSRILDVFECQ